MADINTLATGQAGELNHYRFLETLRAGAAANKLRIASRSHVFERGAA